MRTLSDSQRREKPESVRSSESMRSGGRPSTSCHISLVSFFKSLTLSGSKGRTLHLLKESAKPVPREKKRRKIALLNKSAATESALVVNPFGNQGISDGPDKQTEEVQKRLPSKRNKTHSN